MSVQIDPSIHITAWFRCDRCNAQTYVVTRKGTDEFYWCFHHAEKFLSKLEADGWDIVADERASLYANSKPDGGSAAG